MRTNTIKTKGKHTNDCIAEDTLGYTVVLFMWGGVLNNAT